MATEAAGVVKCTIKSRWTFRMPCMAGQGRGVMTGNVLGFSVRGRCLSSYENTFALEHVAEFGKGRGADRRGFE